MCHCYKSDQQQHVWQLYDSKTEQAADEALITSVYPFTLSVLWGSGKEVQ